jgi:hypothetical protein
MAIPYQPPGVLTVTQLQSSPLTPQLATGVEYPSFIGSAAPGSAGYPTQLDTFTALAYGNTLTLSKQGVQYFGNATAITELGLTVYNPTTYSTIGYGNYNVVNTQGTAANGNIVTTTTLGFVNYAPNGGTVQTISANGSVTTGYYRYGVSYIVSQGNINGTAQLYETGIGTSYTYVNQTNAQGSIILNGYITGSNAAGNGFNVVGRNIYRSANLSSSTAAPYWGAWNQVYNNNAGTTLTYNNTTWPTLVTFADTSSSTFVDNSSTSLIANNPAPSISLNPGDTIQVSYNYADSSYYLPTLFSKYADIESKYGEAFDSNGNILSQLSFGAKLAMLNGATNVVCTAVAPTDSLWSNAFANLVNDHDSTIIVPLTSNESIHAAAAAHCAQMQQYNVFRTAIFGADGYNNNITISQLQQNAASYNRKDIQYVSPTIFRYYNPRLNIENQIGGQYAAAALAGMHAARGPADSLTRQTIAGFSSIGDGRSLVGMNADAANGLCVLEQKGGAIRVRHDISTAPADVNTREWPVIQQTYNMVRNILSLYDQSVVGQYKSNSTGLLAVQNLTNSYLKNLVSKGQLSSYTGLNVSFDSSDPTAVNVSWSYQPVYTILYVSITIGLNLTSGTSSVNVSSNSAANGNTLL